MKVLLIDDCLDTGRLVKIGLSPYDVSQAVTIADAKSHMSQGFFDLLLIDIQLPDGSGLEFCAELARIPQYDHMAKLMLTASDGPAAIVSGLSCGADDYIKKPFLIQELKARVDLRLKKNMEGRDLMFRVGPFEFDGKFQKCFLVEDGKHEDLGLTPTEFRIFLTLARRAGEPVTRQEILDSIWKMHGLHIEPKSIDSHVAHLRKKVGEHGNCIATVHGTGYAYAHVS